KMRTKAWRTFEEVARYILRECRATFGLATVEGKQDVEGRETGEPWEIDVVGYSEDEQRVLFECRHRKEKVKKGEVASLIFIVQDTGSKQGYFVSRVGLQAGAERVAKAKEIGSIIIPVGSTPEQYIMRYLDAVFLKRTDNLGIQEVLKVNVVGPAGEI